MQEGLHRSRSCRAEANLDGSRICQGSISQIESFLMDRVPIEINSRKFRWIEIALNFVEKRRKRGSIEENLSKSCRA